MRALQEQLQMTKNNCLNKVAELNMDMKKCSEEDKLTLQ